MKMKPFIGLRFQIVVFAAILTGVVALENYFLQKGSFIDYFIGIDDNHNAGPDWSFYHIVFFNVELIIFGLIIRDLFRLMERFNEEKRLRKKRRRVKKEKPV